MLNLECPRKDGCAVAGTPLKELAASVEQMYVSTTLLDTGDYTNEGEDRVRAGEITSADIDRLTAPLQADFRSAQAGCFASLHDEAGRKQNTLATLTSNAAKMAVAQCATCQMNQIGEKQRAAE